MKLLSGVKLLLRAMALMGFAVAAHAQVEAFRGSFTITKQMHWGKAVLDPGADTLKSDSGGFPMITIRSEGGKGQSFVQPRGASECKREGPAALLIANQGDRRTVYALRLPEQGIEFVFRPDLERAAQRPEQASKREMLPVLAAER
jgi:hypothetical protein